MEKIMTKLREFNHDRDWDQFHSEVNLAKSICIEASELLECFQWSNTDYDRDAVCEELADVMLYCLQLVDKINANPITIMESKIDKNAKKYPIEKAKGISKKYNEL